MRTARVGGSSIIGEPRGTWHAVGVMSDLSTLIRVHGIRVHCVSRNERGASAKVSWKLKMNPHVFCFAFPAVPLRLVIT